MDDGYSSTAPPHARALLDVWFSFHIIGGHFLVPVLITTFLFSKARRDATLINFGITIILSSITNCLLLYAHEYLGPEPNKTLCIFQAAAFGASAPMWSVAALTLVLQIRSRVELKDVRWLFTMLMMPYISFIAFSVVILVVGLQRPDTVTRSRRTLYCSMEWRSMSLISIGFTSANAFVAFGFGASMCYQICSTLRMVRQVQRTQIRIIPVAIRLLIFLAYIFFALVTSLLSISDRHTYARDIYTSTFGVAYFLVFGSQPDVLWAWCFWRKDETGSRATAESGAPIIEDSTALHKHPTLPDTSHEWKCATRRYFNTDGGLNQTARARSIQYGSWAIDPYGTIMYTVMGCPAISKTVSTLCSKPAGWRQGWRNQQSNLMLVPLY